MSKTIDLKTPDDFEKEIKDIANNLSNNNINKLKQILKQIQEDKQNNRKIHSQSSIVKSLLSKQIYYKNNAFYGIFTIQTTQELIKLGANWNSQQKCYQINQNRLPSEIKNIINILHLQTKRLKTNFNKLINTKQFLHIANSSKAITITETIMLSTMNYINKQLITNQVNKNTNNITDELQQEAIKQIIKDNNDKSNQNKEDNKQTNERIKTAVETMEYQVKDSTFTNTKTMREKFFEALRLNKSNSELENIVKDHIQGTQKRTEFIVKQETRILLQEYQTEQMKQNKITKCKLIHRVPYHQNDRNEHIQLFERGNKGEVFDLDYIKKVLSKDSYNCHCKIRMVLN